MGDHASRYLACVAALKIVAEQDNFDLSPDDLDYLRGKRLWLPQERARARRCVEAVAYGGIDLLGWSRFPLPAEFIAGVIVNFVHPTNYLSACAVFDGVEFADEIITGRSNYISASMLLAHVLRLEAGFYAEIESTEKKSLAKAKKAA